MQTLSFPNPSTRTSPAGFSGSFNANNQGYSGSGRVTVGNENRNLFLQGQVGGGWSQLRRHGRRPNPVLRRRSPPPIGWLVFFSNHFSQKLTA